LGADLLDDVGVPQLAQNGNLAESGAGDALILNLEANALCVGAEVGIERGGKRFGELPRFEEGG